MDYLAVFGTIITVLSFVFAIYSNFRYRRLEDYNRDESWEIYRQSSNVLHFIQEIGRLKIDNSELIRLSSAGERSAIELTVSSIKAIKRFEKKYNEELIKEWLDKGRLTNESHVKTFNSFI